MTAIETKVFLTHTGETLISLRQRQGKVNKQPIYCPGWLLLSQTLQLNMSLSSFVLVLVRIITITNDSDFTKTESSNDLHETQKYKHLWVECENCYGLNYKNIEIKNEYLFPKIK